MWPLTFSPFSLNSEFASLSFCFSVKIKMLGLKTWSLYLWLSCLSRLTSSERARRSRPSPAGPSAHPAPAPRLVSAPPAVWPSAVPDLQTAAPGGGASPSLHAPMQTGGDSFKKIWTSLQFFPRDLNSPRCRPLVGRPVWTCLHCCCSNHCPPHLHLLSSAL